MDNVKNIKKKLPLPLALILIILWSIIRLTGVNVSIASTLGVVIIVSCFVVLFLEINKSGDITLRAFSVDLALAIAATLINTMTMTLLIRQNGISSLHVTDFFISG